METPYTDVYFGGQLNTPSDEPRAGAGDWSLDDLFIGDSEDYNGYAIDKGDVESLDSKSTMTPAQMAQSAENNKSAGVIAGAVKGAIDSVTGFVGGAVDSVKRFGGAIVDGVATTFNVGKWIVAGVGVLTIGYFVVKSIPTVKKAGAAIKRAKK